MVVGKLDPTIGQLCFHRNFQTVRNLQKRTTEMSSRGSKILGGRYGLAENGLKWPKKWEISGDPRWPPPPLRRRRLSVKFHRHGRPEVEHLLGWRVCTVVGQSRLLWSKTSRLANGQNDPTGCSRFGEFFLGFWSSRWCFGG